MTSERRYDDREVGLILKRVAELHEQESDRAPGQALTRREIEEVVAELGIPRALVARALAEVSVQESRNREVWWLGGKTDLMFEHELPGSIDDPTLTQMLEVLRRVLGDPGELKQEGGARIWSTTNRTSRRIHFSVVEHGGKTTLRLEERMPIDARSTVGGTTFGSSFAAFLTTVPLKVFWGKAVAVLAMGPLAATGAAIGFFAGRAIWKRHSRSREGQLGRAFASIVELVPADTVLPATIPSDEPADQ